MSGSTTSFMTVWRMQPRGAAAGSVGSCAVFSPPASTTIEHRRSRRPRSAFAATLDRFAKDIRRLHTADQALYAAFDTFVRLFLTCIPDPPSDTLTAAKVQGRHRYNNYLQNVARNMNGDARAALGELTNRG